MIKSNSLFMSYQRGWEKALDNMQKLTNSRELLPESFLNGEEKEKRNKKNLSFRLDWPVHKGQVK